MTELTVRGGAELRYVAGRLRKAAARDLTRELRQGQRDAVKPLQKEIKASAALTLPKHGGYAAIMSRTVKVATRVGIRAGTVTARIYARGKTELRDVVAVNAGILRHPVYGHRTRWSTTQVPPRFVDEPVDRLFNRVVDESDQAVRRVLDSIART